MCRSSAKIYHDLSWDVGASNIPGLILNLTLIT